MVLPYHTIEIEFPDGRARAISSGPLDRLKCTVTVRPDDLLVEASSGGEPFRVSASSFALRLHPRRQDFGPGGSFLLPRRRSATILLFSSQSSLKWSSYLRHLAKKPLLPMVTSLVANVHVVGCVDIFSALSGRY
jgi:hypothetical protein